MFNPLSAENEKNFIIKKDGFDFPIMIITSTVIRPRSLDLHAHAVPKGTVSLDCLGIYVLTSIELVLNKSR
jgi:hypothetical protein